ncbi:MAG: hypothetical protein V7L14_08270 [Nostoc sp.]|uniref:hypothetical protein n=1 Tax=Nostoc sp. TaxID=1180 RepID=UPI002FF7C637
MEYSSACNFRKSYNCSDTTQDQSHFGLVITEPGQTSEGRTNIYGVRLKSQPTGEVRVTLTPSDDQIQFNQKSAGKPITLTFNAKTWNLEQSVQVLAVDDAVVEYFHSSQIKVKTESGKVLYGELNDDTNGISSQATDLGTLKETLTLRDLAIGISGDKDWYQLLEFNSSDNLRFYLVKISSIDAVRAGVTPLTDILFSDPLTQKITDLGADQFSLAWKDSSGNSTADFKDMVVKIQTTNDPLPLGTNLQGKPQAEVIDLRGVTSQVKADFVVNREAAFNNFIGFYQVTDENSGIDTSGDGKADILTGQAGYTEAAIRGRVAGIDLTFC